MPGNVHERPKDHRGAESNAIELGSLNLSLSLGHISVSVSGEQDRAQSQEPGAQFCPEQAFVEARKGCLAWCIPGWGPLHS